MKVYVVEQGCYEQRDVVGVYASSEAAMAAHPIPADYRYPVTPNAGDLSRPGGWEKRRDGYWANNLDWDGAVSITEYDVIGNGDSA